MCTDHLSVPGSLSVGSTGQLFFISMAVSIIITDNLVVNVSECSGFKEELNTKKDEEID